MRFATAICLLGLCVTATAVINCEDLSPHTCTDFCLENGVLYLSLYGIDCIQSPCDIAALAAEALATTTGVANYAKLADYGDGALLDFSTCDGFVCGDLYDCYHTEYDYMDLCYNFHANHDGQVCVSPDGLLVFASYVNQVYSQGSTSCDVSSFEESNVVFTGNATLMNQMARFDYCEDDISEAALAADVTSLAAQHGSGSLQPGEEASCDNALVKGATIGLVSLAVLSLMTPW